jgi:hypothetical protein
MEMFNIIRELPSQPEYYWDDDQQHGAEQPLRVFGAWVVAR